MVAMNSKPGSFAVTHSQRNNRGGSEARTRWTLVGAFKASVPKLAAPIPQSASTVDRGGSAQLGLALVVPEGIKSHHSATLWEECLGNA